MHTTWGTMSSASVKADWMALQLTSLSKVDKIALTSMSSSEHRLTLLAAKARQIRIASQSIHSALAVGISPHWAMVAHTQQRTLLIGLMTWLIHLGLQ